MKELSFTHIFNPGSSSSAPTLILLHGTGGSEESLLELGRELLPDANFLSPRGKVLEDGMPRFFRRLALGVFDPKEVRAQAKDLADFVTQARTHYNLNKSQFYAVGYSNGANIAAAILLEHPNVFDGAVLFRSLLPLEAKKPSSPTPTPVLILSGEQDFMITRDASEALGAALRETGAEVEQRWQPTGHQLTFSDVLIAKEWLTTQLAAKSKSKSLTTRRLKNKGK